MKKLYLLLLIVSITLALSSSVQAIGVSHVPASQGKATDWRTPDTVMGNTTQLMTRSAGGQDCKKSWLQFDLTELYAENPNIRGNILNAKLTLYGAKSETGGKAYVVSGLNDAAGLEDWAASELTWNNGPGNDINHGTALLSSLTTGLYSAEIPIPVLDVISETPEEYQDELTAFLNADTDGKVTFIFTAGGTCYLWNADQPLGPVLTLYYEAGNNPFKAHDPNPADETVWATAPATLSWTNPDPNIGGTPIHCDVYFGTEPNLLAMAVAELDPGVNSVAVSTFGTLAYDTAYYWQVDCHDSSRVAGELISGEMWMFYLGQIPTADAGPDQVTWLTDPNILIDLSGTASDDGLFTVKWTQVANDAPTLDEIQSDTSVNASVLIEERGAYEFKLTVDDGLLQASDIVRIVVGDNSCDASHLETGTLYNVADTNEDCIVNLKDLTLLILEDWLYCTDTLTNCP
jgi:hypothetical protein